MKTQLVQWGVNGDESNEHDAHMSGMVDEATMAKLKTLQGAIVRQAVAGDDDQPPQGEPPRWPRNEIANGQNADMIALAGDIVAGQQAEIDKMKAMLAAAGG